MDLRLTGLRSRHCAWRAIPARLAMVLICAATVASCKSELYANRDQREANEMVATLRQHGIPADRSVGKGNRVSVSVDESRFAEAVAVLRDNGLPKQEFATLCDVFKRDSLVSSPVQEQQQKICAMEDELSRTVSEIDGVLLARVHLALPENDPLRQQPVPSKAAVVVRHQPDVAMNDLIPQIKMLVANAVVGLSYEHVSVIPIAARTAARNGREAELGPLTRGRGEGLLVAEWPLLSVVALAVALLGTLAFVLRRHGPRVYQLPPTDVVKSP